MTTAFARHKLTFVVHPAAPATQPLSEVWKAITPAAVLALDEFSDADAAAMQAAGVRVIVAMHASARKRWREITTPEHPLGAAQARHLARTHERLGYAYPDDERVGVFADPRLEGVREVCAELGLPAPDVRTVPLDPAAAAEAVQGWLAADPPVTGICAFNDEIAMAVLAGAARLGRNCPRDLAVVGVDDVPGAAVAQPPLTTVVRDFDVDAEHYARNIMAALKGERLPAGAVDDGVRLKIRLNLRPAHAERSPMWTGAAGCGAARSPTRDPRPAPPPAPRCRRSARGTGGRTRAARRRPCRRG
ncbi:substrate-binding domain-containing protein [Amycolatopsis sp. lyj-109]|uniref:substrate-binding domain-containing protein n=1 Tax=Amycolatopsis sp. lyj-109 TaxID=2789287 RepID=UPI003979BB2B